MGIGDLLPFLRKKFPGAVSSTTLKDYKGKKFAIDASVAIHTYVSAAMDVGDGFIRLILRLRQNSIVPVFVFDGPAGRRKALTTEQRANMKIQKIEKYNDMVANPEEYTAEEQEKIRKAMRMKKKEDAELAIKICQAMDVSWIQSPGEADFVMAILSRNKIVDGVFSVDSDMIPHRVDTFVTGLKHQNDGPLIQYHRPTLMKEMKMTDMEFTQFCLLLGSDYNKKIVGIGPVKAYEFMCKYGSVDSIVEAIKSDATLSDKYTIPSDNFDIPDTVAAFMEDDPDSAETVRLFSESEDAALAEVVDTRKALVALGYTPDMANKITNAFEKGWLVNDFTLKTPPPINKFATFGKDPLANPGKFLADMAAKQASSKSYEGVVIKDIDPKCVEPETVTEKEQPEEMVSESTCDEPLVDSEMSEVAQPVAPIQFVDRIYMFGELKLDIGGKQLDMSYSDFLSASAKIDDK